MKKLTDKNMYMARPFGSKCDLSRTESIVRESMYMLKLSDDECYVRY